MTVLSSICFDSGTKKQDRFTKQNYILVLKNGQAFWYFCFQLVKLRPYVEIAVAPECGESRGVAESPRHLR